jgi:hypothetical protein
MGIDNLLDLITIVPANIRFEGAGNVSFNYFPQRVVFDSLFEAFKDRIQKLSSSDRQDPELMRISYHKQR